MTLKMVHVTLSMVHMTLSVVHVTLRMVQLRPRGGPSGASVGIYQPSLSPQEAQISSWGKEKDS